MLKKSGPTFLDVIGAYFFAISPQRIYFALLTKGHGSSPETAIAKASIDFIYPSEI
jgi:hypothetical protein